MKKIAFSNPFDPLLKSLDQFFEGKKPSEKAMVIAMPSLALVGLSFFYVLTPSEQHLQEKISEQTTLKSTIQATRGYIDTTRASNLQGQYQEEIQKAQEEIGNQFEIQEYAENRLVNIIMMQKEWPILLDFVSRSAQEKDVQIGTILSHITTDQENLNFENITIKVKGEGRFANIMRFVNAVEVYGIFVELKDITVDETKGVLGFEMLIKGRRAIL